MSAGCSPHVAVISGGTTGIGLATARRIVCDGHNGSLTVDSLPGRTTFRVWLPLTPGS